MGLYTIPCPQCGKLFLWFSGCLDQRCPDCKANEPEKKHP
jgi:phage FluMu protein Com